jgi:hypothetical protein
VPEGARLQAFRFALPRQQQASSASACSRHGLLTFTVAQWARLFSALIGAKNSAPRSTPRRAAYLLRMIQSHTVRAGTIGQVPQTVGAHVQRQTGKRGQGRYK